MVHGVTPSPRPSRFLALVLLALHAGLFAFWFQTHGPYPRLGVTVNNDGVVVSVLGPPAVGVLERGDRLLRIEGMDLGDPAVLRLFSGDGRMLGPLEIDFERDGEAHHDRLPAVRIDAAERFRSAAFPLAMVVVGTLIAFVVVWRRPLLPTAWVFLGFASVSGLSVLSTLLPHLLEGTAARFEPWLRVYDLITALYPAVFLHFMVMLPRQPWAPGRGRRSPLFWLVAGGYLVPIAFWSLRPWVSHAPWPWPGQGYASAVTVIGVALLIVRYLRPEPGWAPTLGQRFIAVLVGVTMVTSNLVFGDPRFDGWLEAFLVVPWQRVAFTVLLTAWLATPLLLAYLIADEPTFNPRRLFTDGLGYLVLSTLVAAVYLVAVVVLQRLFADVAGENVFVLDLIAAILLALLFAPLREFVQRTLDRMFDRDPTALRAAFDAAGARLLAALDRDEVRLAVETGIAQGLRRPVAVGWSEQGLPSLREPERVPDFARGPLEALLQQATVRLDNLRLTAERAAATQAELRALQAQVQPHFLFNALNALAYLIEADPSAAQRFTERLAGMMRYTVDAGRREAVLLSEEIAFVEDYLGVARERYENPLEFRFEGDPSWLSASVPPLLLQPLVENSLKHGLAQGGVPLHIVLRAESTETGVRLTFADDGVVCATRAKGLGFGLENLAQRMRSFAGAEAEVQARRCTTGGFEVVMTWPVARGGQE